MEKGKKGKGSNKSRFSEKPLWLWILLFLLPLIASELMFYRAGRTISMILFPIAWIGFWAAMLYRFGWIPFKDK